MIWYWCIIVVVFQLVVALVLQVVKRNDQKRNAEESPSSISVIIPFHNEASRILPLIESLNRMNIVQSVEFIFVDDHSTDNTAEVLKGNLNIPYRIIQNTEPKGKKRAIRTGVIQASHDYVLTWDADIILPVKYFESLSEIPRADLNIFPVQMNAENFIGKLAIIEFSFLKTLGFGMASITKPSICYGANLGFSKQVFLEMDEHRDDYALPSGDDLFLLNAMLKRNRDIRVHSDDRFAVGTMAPSGFRDLIKQRQRWFGKMNKLFNPSTFWALVLLILVQVVLVLAGVLSFFHICFLIPLGVKYVAEVVASWSFVKRKPAHFLILLIHQVWYPIYLLSLLVPLKKEARWKVID